MGARRLVMLFVAAASGACWSLSGFSGGDEAGDGGTDAPSEAAPADAAADGPGVDAADATADAPAAPSVVMQTPVRADTESVDLTALGTLDWTQRGQTAGDRCAPCTPWIGALMSAQTMDAYNDDVRIVTWSNGTPRASASVHDGLYVEGSGSAFTMRVKYPGQPSRLTVWFDTFWSGGELRAQLEGDASTLQKAQVSALPGNARYHVAIDFVAAADGALVFTWTETTALTVIDSGTPGQVANVAIMASALAPRP